MIIYSIHDDRILLFCWIIAPFEYYSRNVALVKRCPRIKEPFKTDSYGWLSFQIKYILEAQINNVINPP